MSEGSYIKSACFIGHRKIEDTPELREQLKCILIKLIEDGTVNFIFGDHSEFNDLCYETVTEIKEKFPAVRRIKFRRDYEEADDYTKKFLMFGYEENVCPKGVSNAGKASYIERNRAMIRESDVCIFYYDENYVPINNRRLLYDGKTKSGTALAFLYAKQKHKRVYNLFINDSVNFSHIL